MITDLRVQQFRSYKDTSYELSNGVNIIVGPNASGKTNLLEAILVLARGSSYRAKDAELINLKNDWARLDAHLDDDSLRTIKITGNDKPEKTLVLHGRSYKRIGLQQTIPVVLFEPNHLLLFSGGPELRRVYLDDLLEQTRPGYGSIRRQYRRSLAQRNALLKQPKTTEQQLFPWNVRLSQLAGQIVRNRAEITEEINSLITKLYKSIAATKTKVEIDYTNRWPVESYESNLLRQLELDAHKDHERGFTSAGPHREDLVMKFDGHPAEEVASRGEIRTAVLALKIIELQILEKARGITPLLLLDDVFSELDGKRRHALTDYLAPYQTFITTTDADLVIKQFTQQSNIIAVDKTKDS